MSQHPHNRARPDESGAVQPLDTPELTLASAIGKYRLLGALGHGGMADVYLAVADGPEGFRKLCVLKLLKETMAQDEEYRAMFLDEARLAARLNHPNIVQTFEVGETHGRLMLAMEYVEGQTANRVRKRLTPEQFPLTSCISILCDVLEALDYAHRLTDFDGTPLHIVHRDVSPQNIVIGYDARVKLLDFGIAKSSAALQETQAGVLKGKVGYMAPEQANMERIDGRADVFSVGVILWELIAGRRLTEGATGQEVLLRRIEGRDPKILEAVPEVDPSLAAICDRAMACAPDDRYPSAAEMQSDLEAWLANHREPNRKELGRAVREAFATEREHLRAIVEQRMADSAMSGMRQALTGNGLPSLGRLHATTEVPSITPGRISNVPTAPGSGAQLSPMGQPTLPMIDPSAGVPSSPPLPPSAMSSQQRAISNAPQPLAYPAPKRSSLPFVVAGGAGLLLAVGVVAVATRSTSSPSPTSPPASAQVAPTAAETGAAPGDSKPGAVPAPHAATATSTTTIATAAGPASLPPSKGGRPSSFVAPNGKGPAQSPATHAPSSPPVSAPPATTPGTALTPPAPKPSARPLDEKDPYSP
ncbi:MAG: serine/threonine protein kinase [Deltaproteobacteria bacterium]|nr:serine/threonine protein kinase [Deltaproteobacteria bacterium]